LHRLFYGIFRRIPVFSHPELPFAHDALEPYMSAETLHFHHDKHHKSYVDTLNGLIEGEDLAEMSLEDIILHTHDKEDAQSRHVFNNAAQHWNHSFFWTCLSPAGGESPEGNFAEMLERDLGGESGFRQQFRDQGVAHFGSGWVWLVFDNDRLEVMTTHDADLPLAHGKAALLCCDLWEHAYYLDHQNRRQAYLDVFMDEMLDWKVAEDRFAQAESAANEMLHVAKAA
jgi:superoxide dismutase, Fe-Mn family